MEKALSCLMCLSASKGLTMIIVSFEFALVDHTIPLAEFYDSPFKNPLYQLLLGKPSALLLFSRICCNICFSIFSMLWFL